jgi:hypothetical protein
MLFDNLLDLAVCHTYLVGLQTQLSFDVSYYIRYKRPEFISFVIHHPSE